MISSIKRSGDQLSRIIDDILDLSKVEAGKMNMEKSEICLFDFMTSLKSFFVLAARKKGLNLNFEINHENQQKIITCSTRLHQILVNLIGNAIKFSDNGDITVSASVRSKEQSNTLPNNEKNYLEIKVKDSGSGLTKEQIKHLFQPFNQLDTSMTRKHGGTGLGLALSQKLARAMDGEITAIPNQDQTGCTFSLTIPIELIESTVPYQRLLPAEQESSDIESDEKSLKHRNILIVEDSLDNQELFGLFLSMAGANIDLANNGQEGVEKALHGNYDLVLMDIQMPVLDGYGAIQQLRSQGYVKPIVALTAHGMLEDRKKCIEIGSNGHLTKPVDRESLIQKVHSAIQQS